MQTAAIIAGCGRSGTTSLFQWLRMSRAISPSKIKETNFFLATFYGTQLVPAAYDSYFARADTSQIRLEASTAYFYAVPEVPDAICSLIPDARIIVILREPYDRLMSEFAYLKSHFRIPTDLTFPEYVDHCMRLSEVDARNERNRAFLAVRTGYYDRYFPYWAARFPLRVLFFDDLVAAPQEVLRDLRAWLGIPTVSPGSVENRGISFRSARIQGLALALNEHYEPWLRRHPAVKNLVRSAYLHVNGTPKELVATLPADHSLLVAYQNSLRILRSQLLAWDDTLSLPPWLS
jgi:hypothetical protein